MNLRLFLIIVLALGLSACGKTDDSADATGEEAGATAEATQQQSAVGETMESADEAVANSAEQVAEAGSGESVYNRACAGCHLSGAANAPKLGDKAAWAGRIAKGKEALLQSVIDGIPGTAMMARGTCNACSDQDLAAAVDYMIAQSQ